ncbi:MAG TPA: septal ring lytic transglycosylase RlpA family protein [Thermoanaerobaculia bacterium]|nr:septal ring lytic transglycosylase RlpA family protein [Thermoanaerobaculia bacterium]
MKKTKDPLFVNEPPERLQWSRRHSVWSVAIGIAIAIVFFASGKVPAPSAGDNAPIQRGLASWYGQDFHGRPTAQGEAFDMYAYTAAHRSLPLGTHVRVRNLENGRVVVVRINDRGPYKRGVIIDLSRRAAGALGMVNHGRAQVRVEVVPGRTRVGPRPSTAV